jgi:transposase
VYLLRAGCSWRLLPHDFPLGRRSIAICAAGSAKGSGRGFTTRWSWRTGSAPDAKLRPPAPSSTARASGRQIKRGAQMLRCRKEGPRPQAPHHDRNGRPPAYGRGPCRQHSGPRRRQGRAGTLAAIIPLRGDRVRPSRRCRASPAGQWDGGYAGRLVKWAKDKTNVTLEIVRRMPWMKGFVVIRRPLSWFACKPLPGSGWVIERTDPWIMKCRRLARDYEQHPSVVETLITIAAAATLVRRWP